MNTKYLKTMFKEGLCSGNHTIPSGNCFKCRHRYEHYSFEKCFVRIFLRKSNLFTEAGLIFLAGGDDT